MTKRDPKPKTTPKKQSGSGARSAGGRPTKHDWSAIRREFIRGDDTVTLKTLSDKPGAPTYDAIKARSAREDWAELRAEFRHRVDTKTRALNLETVEEVRLRQAEIGKALQTAAVRGLTHLKPEELGAFAVARLATAGAQLERQARGMEEFTVRVEDLRSPADLKNLTTDQLMELLERRRRARGAAKA
ncbi:hypothetical protein [Deinococcus apachensis]|uniref:hypothetical protein n=1 Tax=Deinococcus apachensis TaxID=309886 RepID=UPI00037159D9|nr:hypothetical protein [Deinococcus apachensis]